MTTNTLASWHQVVAQRNAGGLASLLADDVVFHSPVVHTPQVGRAITTRYLAAAFRVIANDSFRYVRELVGERDAVLEFQVEIEDVVVNGVDMIKWDDAGRIVDTWRPPGQQPRGAETLARVPLGNRRVPAQGG